MYLTADKYAAIIGEAAPADFDDCLIMAESTLDLHTMNFYAGMAFDGLPAAVQRALERATAYQVSAITQRGGIAGMTEEQVQSGSVGKVSFSTNPGALLCRPAAAFLPFLNAFARGYEG